MPIGARKRREPRACPIRWASGSVPHVYHTARNRLKAQWSARTPCRLPSAPTDDGLHRSPIRIRSPAEGLRFMLHFAEVLGALCRRRIDSTSCCRGVRATVPDSALCGSTKKCGAIRSRIGLLWPQPPRSRHEHPAPAFRPLEEVTVVGLVDDNPVEGFHQLRPRTVGLQELQHVVLAA